mgnify:CR=1 FL=1
MFKTITTTFSTFIDTEDVSYYKPVTSKIAFLSYYLESSRVKKDDTLIVTMNSIDDYKGDLFDNIIVVDDSEEEVQELYEYLIKTGKLL